MKITTYTTGAWVLAAMTLPFAACAQGLTADFRTTIEASSTAGTGGGDGGTTGSTASVGAGGAGGQATTPVSAASSSGSGSGSSVCGQNLADCGGLCVNLTHDPKNCGQCGKACAAGTGMTSVCIMGACDAICQAGLADCNAKLADGCESTLASDLANCGGCAKACAVPNHAKGACAMSACVIATCDFGWGDCDKQVGNGCEADLNSAQGNCGVCGNACGQGKACVAGTCKAALTNFVVQDAKDIVYQGIGYLALKVTISSTQSASVDWCQDYTNLCLGYGYLPTGCGQQFNSGGYGDCKTIYKSDGVSDSLGCNPSSGVSSAAQQAGFSGADSSNSFGFHYCGGTCEKTMCSGQYCNTALSYYSADSGVGYTLCKK